MIPLPNWIGSFFSKGQCMHCKEKLLKKGVYGIGLIDEEDDGLCFTFNYKCPKCSKLSLFTGFQTTFEAYIEDMGEIVDKIHSIENNSHVPQADDTPESEPEIVEKEKPILKKNKSKISKDELQALSKILDESDSHSKFLEKIGGVTHISDSQQARLKEEYEKLKADGFKNPSFYAKEYHCPECDFSNIHIEEMVQHIRKNHKNPEATDENK